MGLAVRWESWVWWGVGVIPLRWGELVNLRGIGWFVLAVLVMLVVGGCAQGEGARGACERPERLGWMPDELLESSGLAASRRYPGVLWSHNDSGHDPVVFAIDTTGQLLGRVRVSGARNVDWEDMELAPCAATGDDGGGGQRSGKDCLYIADTGDNRLRRDDAAIYRVPEPAPGDTVTAPAERFPVRFPDGPRDVEALYILPGGTVHLVSKGRGHPIAIYRYPPPLRAGEHIAIGWRLKRCSGTWKPWLPVSLNRRLYPVFARFGNATRPRRWCGLTPCRSCDKKRRGGACRRCRTRGT